MTIDWMKAVKEENAALPGSLQNSGNRSQSNETSSSVGSRRNSTSRANGASTLLKASAIRRRTALIRRCSLEAATCVASTVVQGSVPFHSRRAGRPHEIAQTIVFLCSDEAS